MTDFDGLFEGMTIGQLRALTRQFLEQNPQFETAQEILDRREQEKEELKKDLDKKNFGIEWIH